MSKNYLILGASSDVGIELIKKIDVMAESSTIWAHYHSSASRIKSIIPKNNNTIIPFSADFSNLDEVENAAKTIIQSYHIPDAIVHLSAPKLQFEKFKKLEWNDCIFDAQIQVGSVFRLLQILIPHMLKTDKRSKIVFMLSENTINMPAKFSTKYTMSKYMLLGLMRSLAAEYEGKNININALSPSMIDTKFLSNIDRRLLEVSGATEHILKPQDVVPWLWRLLSEYSDDMNGENIFFSGGE